MWYAPKLLQKVVGSIKTINSKSTLSILIRNGLDGKTSK